MAIFWGKIDKTKLKLEFLYDVDKFLAESPYNWYVMEGFRSFARSKQLYDAYIAGTGPKAAPPGSSAHNYGLAIDVVLDSDPNTPGDQPTWNTALAGWVWLKTKSIAHPRLKNGWSFGDAAHIERYRWKLYK